MIQIIYAILITSVFINFFLFMSEFKKINSIEKIRARQQEPKTLKEIFSIPWKQRMAKDLKEYKKAWIYFGFLFISAFIAFCIRFGFYEAF